MQRRAAIVVVVALLSAGCGADVTQADAAAAAVAFVRATPQQACARLAPDTRDRLERQARTSCERALAAAALPRQDTVEAVDVAGQSAQVRLAGQAIFLARFPDGWLVTAAGCRRADPDPAVPYECAVES